MVQPLLGDVMITRDKIDGLMAGLLVSRNTPTGTTRLEHWLCEHKESIGQHYASELHRHYRRYTFWVQHTVRA